MVPAARARELLSRHGRLRPQPASNWKGAFPLPAPVEEFYKDVGPVDVSIEAYGNPFFLPRLASLWKFQAGYRWNGLNRKPIEGWDDDWLVIADQGGDPFIVSRAVGAVHFAVHGTGSWELTELFPDLNTMSACLGHLGAVVEAAGDAFTDDDCRIRPESRERAKVGLVELLGSEHGADLVLETLAWG